MAFRRHRLVAERNFFPNNRLVGQGDSRYDRSSRTSEIRPFTNEFQLDEPEQAKGVRATYTTDPLEGEAWLSTHVIGVAGVVLGFDIEYKPQFVKKKLGGKENRTAVLQLATETACLVLHIIHLRVRTFPKYLVQVLADQNIPKVGCGIRSDVVKLLKDTGLQCKCFVDLVLLASKMGYPKEQGYGLKALSKRLLGMELTKPQRITLSDWERFPLGKNQVQYAALDAWAGVKLYLHMKKNVSGNIAISDTDMVKPDPVQLLRDTETVICHVCGKKRKGNGKLQDHLAQAAHVTCVNCGMMFVQHIPKKHLKSCALTQAHASL